MKTIDPSDTLHIHKAEIKVKPDSYSGGVRYILIQVCPCGWSKAIDMMGKEELREWVRLNLPDVRDVQAAQYPEEDASLVAEQSPSEPLDKPSD